MGEEKKIFYRNCGEILRLALDIESTLDFFISNYFCSPQSYKTFLFKDLILMEQTGLGFKRKIEIFKKICEREKIGRERVKKIIDAIQFVREKRNMVSHGEAFVSDIKDGIKLQKGKSVKNKKDEIKITDELVKEVEEKRLFSTREIVKIHIELSDPSGEKNIEW